MFSHLIWQESQKSEYEAFLSLLFTHGHLDTTLEADGNSAGPLGTRTTGEERELVYRMSTGLTLLPAKHTSVSQLLWAPRAFISSSEWLFPPAPRPGSLAVPCPLALLNTQASSQTL